jgi:hypothetical protein
MARGRSIRRGGRGGGGGGVEIGGQVDLMQLASTNLPVVMNGMFSFSGNQMSFYAQMHNFNFMNQQYLIQSNGMNLNSA